MPPRPPIPTFDPLDEVAVIDSGPMPESLRNPDPSRPATEGDRRDLRRRIRAAWPALADVLSGSPGRRLSTETLAVIARDIERNPQDRADAR